MINGSSFSYKSFIKKIYVELPKGYIFKHHSLENVNDLFLGRKDIKRDFLNVLKNGNYRGAYLVTGYRGMGKTSFVRQVLDLHKQRAEKEHGKSIKVVNISLAQTHIGETDILKYIVNQLMDDIRTFPEYRVIRRIAINNIFSWCWPIILCGLIVLNIFLINQSSDKTEPAKSVIENMLGLVSLAGLMTLLVYTLINWLFTGPFSFWGSKNSPRAQFKKIFEDLSNLQIRCYAQVTSEDSLRETFAASAMALFRKDTKTYALASPREIESTLISIIGEMKHFKDYIFVFDELDKVDSKLSNSFHERVESIDRVSDDGRTYLDDLRERRHIITHILSALKFFINEANAALIFIAGREMFEASLADISDRQLSISSIFHRVIYVDSFLKDNSDKGTSMLDIGTLVESFLESVILPDNFSQVFSHSNELPRINNGKPIDLLTKYYIYQILDRNDLISFDNEIKKIQKDLIPYFNQVTELSDNKKLKSLFSGIESVLNSWVKGFWKKKLMKKEAELILVRNKFLVKLEATLSIANQQKEDYAEARKVIFVLQNFISYLVYRSNGSPRKMVKLFEEYIFSCDSGYIKKIAYKSIVVNPYQTQKQDKFDGHQFLSFPYFTQYKLGFNSYLFQPLLTMYSSFIKRYSDNTLVSIPYLIDNLIKFHPTAFSVHNLELLPEILSTNKSPISRPFLEELVAFLGRNHIRRTEAGIFEYKFYDKTHNEIMFMSKMFEDEAAAYNFTLDENYSVKKHLMEKIRTLRSHHKDFENNSDNPVSSIIYLNRLLGDVRFQDEEYEDAIISYQDALQMIQIDKLSINLLISFIRIKLKLGLTYEKIKAFEFALGHYSGVIEASHKELDLSHKQLPKLGIAQVNIFRELMHFILQAHMATLYLQEKLYEGITYQKIKNTYDSFEDLLNIYEYDYVHRDIILASASSNVGTILFYKNFPPSHHINKSFLKFAKINNDGGEINKIEYAKFRKDISNAFPAAIRYSFVTSTLRELTGKLNPNNTDSRVCSTAIIYYKHSLQLLLGINNEVVPIADIKSSDRKNSIKYLLKKCPAMVYKLSPNNQEDISFRSSQHRRYLTSIGHTLSKLGDSYLPLIESRSADITKVLHCFSFEATKEIEKKEIEKIGYERYSRERLLWGYFGGDSEYSKSLDFHIDTEDIEKGLFPDRFVLHIYYLSSLFFSEAGDTANCSFQLRKILFSLRAIKFSNSDKEVLKYLEFLQNNLMRRILELSSLLSHSSDRPQLGKFKKNFIIGTLRTPLKISHELYANVSNNSETKEAILSYTLLKMTQIPKITGDSLKACFDSQAESRLISPYNSVSHQITRMMELELQTVLNYKILKGYFQDKFGTLTKQNFKLIGEKAWDSKYYYLSKLYDIDMAKFDTAATDESIVKFSQIIGLLPFCYHSSWKSVINSREYLTSKARNNVKHYKKTWNLANKKDFCSLKVITKEVSELTVNSIFNLSQVISICSTYGINYIVSYSYLAGAHKSLGYWLKFLHLCRFINAYGRMNLPFEEELQDLVGNQSVVSLDTLTHYQISLQNYYGALQMHKEGDPYSHQLNNMLYLEDDFNDNLYHFGAGFERLRIHSGDIRQNIKFLKDEINKANMHKYSAYLGD